MINKIGFELFIWRQVFKSVIERCKLEKSLKGITMLWTKGEYLLSNGEKRFGSYYRYLKDFWK